LPPQIIRGIDEHGGHGEQGRKLQDLRHPIQLERSAERDDPRGHRLADDQACTHQQRNDCGDSRPMTLAVLEKQIEQQDRAGRQPEKDFRGGEPESRVEIRNAESTHEIP
jgi:hypothetical protein